MMAALCRLASCRLAGAAKWRPATPCLERTNSSYAAPQGVIAAPFTPFKANGDVDYQKFPAYFRHLEMCGVPAVFVMGTTGEGLALTVEERKAVAEAWLKGKPKFKVIIHIGTSNLKDSQALASHAEQCGADAISCVAPNYYKPQTEEQLTAYMAEVASAAPRLPFYLYDINFITGIHLNMPRFFDLAKDKIPNLYGIKHSSTELASLTNCYLHSGRKFHVLLGSDELYLPVLPLGITATVPNSFIAPYHLRIRAAFEKGDMATARAEQYRCQQICSIRAKYGSGPAAFTVSRSIMSMLGLDLGPPRLPLTMPPVEVQMRLESELKIAGFFESMKP